MQSVDGCHYFGSWLCLRPWIQFPGFRNFAWNVHPGFFRFSDQFYHDAVGGSGNLLPDHTGCRPGCHCPGSRTVLCLPAQKIILFLYEISGTRLHRDHTGQLHCQRVRLDQYVIPRTHDICPCHPPIRRLSGRQGNNIPGSLNKVPRRDARYQAKNRHTETLTLPAQDRQILSHSLFLPR